MSNSFARKLDEALWDVVWRLGGQVVWWNVAARCDNCYFHTAAMRGGVTMVIAGGDERMTPSPANNDRNYWCRQPGQFTLNYTVNH